jgi:hypothetical protein
LPHNHSSLPSRGHAGNYEPQQLPGPAGHEGLAFMSKANVKPIGTKEVLFFERNGTNIDISKLGLGEPYFRELSG